jgi:dipeptidyl aminopeptidase/acylaminoacyl peptidase
MPKLPSSSRMLAFVLALTLLPCCAAEKRVPVEEIIKFESDNATLEGTLNLPDAYGKYPVVIFIHGSGMRTRDDFQSFVSAFNAAGVATFRYDKRGVGNSGGSYIDVGTLNSERAFAVLATDASAAIDHLKKDSRIDPRKIIVAGVSQAGWIIPEINTLTDVYLSICISGPSVSVGQEIYYSDLAERGTYSQAAADSVLKQYNGPEGFDPISRIVKMKSPSLWIFGDKDVSIPVKRSIAILDSLRSKNNLPLEMKIFKDADHGLYNVTTHHPEDYITVMIDWVKSKL